MTAPRASVSNAAISAFIDLVLVFVFVVIGRTSHDEGITISGTAETWWPFLVGLAVGWLVSRAWRRPLGIAQPGIPIWISTVAIGMLLRVASGQGVQWAFVIVATVVLAVFIVGWRALAAGFRRIRPRRAE